jgi:hypothetical protein
MKKQMRRFQNEDRNHSRAFLHAKTGLFGAALSLRPRLRRG